MHLWTSPLLPVRRASGPRLEAQVRAALVDIERLRAAWQTERPRCGCRMSLKAAWLHSQEREAIAAISDER
jgi:hypothetical protein